MKLKDENRVNEYTSRALREVLAIKTLSGVANNLLLDDMLYTHSLRVAKLATQLAITLKLPDKIIQKVCLAGMLHDIGKLLIDPCILYKPGKLTADEFEVIKKHPVDGYKMLKSAGVDDDICNMVLRHHEKRSGNGYPNGISEKSISEEIITVADIFSALSEERSYHQALGYWQALDFINSFEDLDKKVLKALRQSFDD